MIDTILTCNAYRIVGGAIINDKPFDHVIARHFTRKVAQRYGQRARFIEARNLDDQFPGRHSHTTLFQILFPRTVARTV